MSKQSAGSIQQSIEVVLAYHERTKHRFDGYARGPHSIDWEAQPDSFRRFAGAPLVQLPLPDPVQGPTYADLFTGSPSEAEPWSLAGLSRLLFGSMALSAWKQYGTARWSLRCNPSSGNLHPTETYLVLVNLPDLQDGLYHYRPDTHQLELRCRFSGERADTETSVYLAFSSIHWREAWKYGERAYRYCQLDLGHALAAVSYAASALGYRASPMLALGADELTSLLGLDQLDRFHADEGEYGDLLVAIHHPERPTAESCEPLLERCQTGEWYGQANRLDPRHLYDWPVIDEVAEATRRPTAWHEPSKNIEFPPPLPPANHPLTLQSACQLFQQRRSAQAFDPAGRISAGDFYRLLDRLLPRTDYPPWSSLPWDARLHLILFVHRVDGLEPGLYCLVRRPDFVEPMQRLIRDDLAWHRPDGAPAHLPFYRLVSANARKTAMTLSCMQDIAGDSAFSLGMLAEFSATLHEAPWRYDELFWEAGVIGQSLYLEAEAIGLRGTGIGCYFDDGVHDMLGLAGNELQSMYHFTVGLPLIDRRLITLPPYGADTDFED